MKKTYISRKGFTLAEMVCVIAIIVVLSSFFVTSVKDYIGGSKMAADKVKAHDDTNVNVEEDVQGYLRGYTRDTAAPTATTGNGNGSPIPGEAAPGAGGGGAATSATAPASTTPNPPPQTTTSQEQTTETALPPATSQHTSGGGAGNNGGSSNGTVSAPGGTVTSGKGVVSITPSQNGTTYQVKIQKSEWETLNITITVVNGQFVMTIGDGTGGGKWILDQGVFKDLYKTNSYTLNAEQIAYLKNTFGLAIG
ncbi:MAG: type II secretion system protein [Clostridiales bacterium]|nr:type II secretion system protein [Clostridiales bacterium]